MCRFDGLCPQIIFTTWFATCCSTISLCFASTAIWHVVTHRNARMRRHRSAVGVGERDLALSGPIEFRASIFSFRCRRSRIAVIFSTRFSTGKPSFPFSVASLL